MPEDDRQAGRERPAGEDEGRDHSDPRAPAAASDERRREAEREPPVESPEEPPAAPPDDSVWEDGLLTEPGPGD